MTPLRSFSLVVTALLFTCASATATLILYEPFDYGSTAGGLSGKGGSSTEVGFLAADTWSGGNYHPAGLTFGDLKVVGGLASNINASVYRRYNVTQTGKIYGSYLCKLISGCDGSDAIGAVMLVRTSAGGDNDAEIDMAADEYGAVRKCGVRIRNNNGGAGAAAAAGSQTAAYGTPYLALFSASNLVTTGTATQGVTLWLLTTNQFAYWKPLGLTEDALNGAALGTANNQVYGKAAASKAGISARMQAADYLKLFIYSGAVVQFDEVRISNASLDEVTPLNLGWEAVGAANVTVSAADAYATLVGLSADAYLFWDTADKGTGNPAAWANTNFLGAGLSPQLLSSTISSLASGSTYAFRFFATNTTSGATAWSAAGSILTLGPPTVNNGAGPAPGLGSAVLNGQLVSTGGVPTDVYVYWGTDTNNWAHTNYLGSRGIGALSVTASNLYYGVSYWYRCFATNQYGGVWADTATNFLTQLPTTIPYRPGLQAGTLAAAWDTTTANPATTNFLGPHGGRYNTSPPWADYRTWVYTGQIYLNGSTYYFAENIDDDTLLKIDGTTYLNDVTWDNVGVSSAITKAAGWHDVEIRFGNGTGGAGPANTPWTASIDPYGFGFNTNGYNGTTQSQYKYPEDNGTMNLFRYLPANATTLSLAGVTNTGSSAAVPGAATFNANVQATGSVFEVWVYWGLADGTNNPNAWQGSTLVTTITNTVDVDVSKTLAGLAPGTVYFTYRIVNAATNFWATPSGSAIVEATADAPKIETRPATNVHTNRATLNGMLTSTGTSATVVSVYWGSDGDRILTGDWAFTNDFGVCTDLPYEGLAYATNVTGLLPGQEYTYRYYAANATTGVWGDAVSFVTWQTPTVDNDGGATAVTATSATLRGTVLTGNPLPTTWIYWGTTDSGTDKGAWDKPVVSLGTQALGSVSAVVNGLLANKTYWYRCYVSNDCGEAWAPASASFITAAPGVSINDPSVTEGAEGTTTTLVFTVSLSAPSAVAVSVDYATSNGTATVADNDYAATSGTLTIPAGNLTGQIPVTVNGNDLYESGETLYVNLSGWANATNIDSQGVGTIVNDDWAFYVRGDGLGSDAYSGATWTDAFATLQKALDTVPYFAANVVHVQASTGSQFYATCTRSLWAQPSTYRPFIVSFIGGWQNVDTAPVQSGMSRVKDPTASKPGFQLLGPYSYHSEPKTVLFDRFVFTNVTDGIQFFVSTATDNSSVLLTVSNTIIHAENNGILIDYNRPGYQDWNIRAYVRSSTITAGLSGSGEAVRMNGNHMPLDVDAGSTLWSAGGANVVLSASTAVEMPVRLAGTMGFPASGYDLVKSGAAYLRLSDPNTFSHKLGIYDGPLRGTAMSAGSPFGTAAVELNQGGGLRLDAAAGVTDTPMGTLNVRRGNPNLYVNGGSGGTTWTATDLQRDNRAVLTVLGSGGAALQTTDKFKIAAQPAVANGMVAPYLIEASGDFLTYNAGGRGIERVASYTAGDINAAAATSVYSAPSAQTLTDNREVYALKTGANISGANVELTVGGGGVVVNGAATIGCNLQFNGQEGVIWNSATLAMNGVIKGTNGLTKAGSGTLTLATTNVYSGATTINAGTLGLAVSDALPPHQPLVFGFSPMLDLNGKTQTVSSLSLPGGTVYNSSATPGVLNIGTRFTYNGLTDQLVVRNNTHNAPAATPAFLNLTGPVTFDIADGQADPDVTFGGYMYVGGNANFYASVTGANAPVTKEGAGHLYFQGSNTYAGTVTINRGTMGGAFTLAGTSPFGAVTNPLVLNGNGTALCSNSGNWNFGAVTFSGNNTLRFSVGQSSGTWTTPSVTRAAGSRGVLAFSGSWTGFSYYDYLGANEHFYVSGWMSPDPNVNGMLPASYVGVGYQADWGVASHAVVSTVNGDVLRAAYDQTTFTGATATKKVDLAAAAALGTDASIWALRTSYNVTVSAGTPTLTLGSGGLIANATCTISPSLKFGAAGTGEGLVYVAATRNATLGGQMLTTTGLTKFGAGILTLAAASPSYAGETWVQAGTLSLRDPDALGIGSEPIYLQYGATLEIGDPFTVNRSIVGAGRIATGNGPFTLGPTGSLTPLTNTIATLSVEEMNFQGTYNWEYNENGADLIKVANLSFSGAPKVAVTWIGSGDAPKGTNTVFTYLGSDPAIDGLTARAPAGLQGRFLLDATNKQVKLVIETLVPRGTVIFLL